MPYNLFLKLYELAAFLQQLSHYQSAKKAQLGISLLLLTVDKTVELLQATLNQFNLSSRIWKISAHPNQTATKASQGNRNEIPPIIMLLSVQIIAIIRQLSKHQFKE